MLTKLVPVVVEEKAFETRISHEDSTSFPQDIQTTHDIQEQEVRQLHPQHRCHHMYIVSVQFARFASALYTCSASELRIVMNQSEAIRRCLHRSCARVVHYRLHIVEVVR